MERLTRIQPAEEPVAGWWERYAANLEDSSLTDTARAVILEDSRYIVERGILGSGAAGAETWPASRQRSGLVMGAVQSGKTASMLGVTARALDAGVDIVVVLAGTRVALWRQTYDRLVEQLALEDHPLLLPAVSYGRSAEGAALGPSDLYQVSSARARRALRDQTPMVFVVMKHGQHLRAAARILHERIYPQLVSQDRPVHMLVLDDEADDGSILDSVVENDLDPSQDALKQIPRHIVDLWARREEAPATADPRLHATYVGYTATPQANFLQADQNPLAPSDFIAALRTPADVGALEPRSTTYREPQGVSAFYTGGEVFYRKLDNGDALLVVEPDVDPDDADPFARRRHWISEAVRAYLVAGAVRLWRDPSSRRLRGLSEQSFESRAAVKAASPLPHTMLFHPSSGVKDHFEAAAELVSWANGASMDEARAGIQAGVRGLSVEHLSSDMEENPHLWTGWLDSYRASASAVALAFELEQAPMVPAHEQWEEIRRLLLEELIPCVRIAIVNSDPAADDRPEFDPQQGGDGWRAARDLCTIFVSGNVMARGLTLEGLATTLFLRSSGDPTADTQMQMQRWFGYRGFFIELCRVMLPASQVNLFRQYHESDEGLRKQIVEAMNSAGTSAPSPLVIEGARFRSTGRIAGVSKVPLCPGATPFIDIANGDEALDPNMEVLRQAFTAQSHDLVVRGLVRGRILSEPLSLEEAAALLDRLSYSSYVPEPEDPTTTRWTALEAQIGLTRDQGSSLLPLFRAPNVAGSGAQAVNPSRCPYNIAAYLRLWRACLDRSARGLFPTEDGERPWASLDLGQRRAGQPRFYVGIRYGSGEPERIKDARGDDALPFDVRAVRKHVVNGVVTTGWGSRNPGDGPDAYLSDQLFDYHHHHALPIPVAEEGGPLWRPVGAPGLLLFHVVRADEIPNPAVAVGVALPLGGPDHFAARVRGSR